MESSTQSEMLLQLLRFDNLSSPLFRSKYQARREDAVRRTRAGMGRLWVRSTFGRGAAHGRCILVFCSNLVRDGSSAGSHRLRLFALIQPGWQHPGLRLGRHHRPHLGHDATRSTSRGPAGPCPLMEQCEDSNKMLLPPTGCRRQTRRPDPPRRPREHSPRPPVVSSPRDRAPPPTWTRRP